LTGCASGGTGRVPPLALWFGVVGFSVFFFFLFFFFSFFFFNIEYLFFLLSCADGA